MSGGAAMQSVLGGGLALQQNGRPERTRSFSTTEDMHVPHAFRPMPPLAACLALLALTALPSCIPVMVGGAAAGGAYVAGQERSVGTQVSDTGIRAQINDKWLRYSSDMYSQLSLSVNDGRVLITGAVSNPEWKPEAVRLAWQVDGVKAVNDEIQVSDSSSLSDSARDEWITTRLRSAILFDSQVASTNYTIDVVNGIVYLSGSARTQGELDRVTDYARNIPNVKRVVSYVQVRPGAPSSAGAASAPPQPAASAPAPMTQGAPPSPPPQPGATAAPPTTLAPAPAPAPSGGAIEVKPLE